MHTTNRTRLECDVCHKHVVKLRDHKKMYHEDVVECQKCQKQIARCLINVHEKTCQIKCPMCPRIFTNQRYPTQHRNSKHNL